jgi:DNA-directed RNA polymerase subunit omega
MARFTVADCMENIPNRFNMTIIASIRARQIENSSQTQLENIENDKPTVLALREIADNLVNEELFKVLE